jgi:pimeloyl-ACP methyl ester carboxylesterase
MSSAGHESGYRATARTLLAQYGPDMERLPPSAGCFHFDGLMQQLHEEFRLYALDFVGQGRSWPEQGEGLAYSVDLWSCQVCDFIRFARDLSAPLMQWRHHDVTDVLPFHLMLMMYNLNLSNLV